MDIFGMSRHGLTTAFEQIAVLGVLVVALLSLLYAWFLRASVLKKDKGTEKMQEVWDAIRVGANGYLQSQLKTILPAMAILTIALFLSVITGKPSNTDCRLWPYDRVYFRRLVFVDCWSAGYAHGHSG